VLCRSVVVSTDVQRDFCASMSPPPGSRSGGGDTLRLPWPTSRSFGFVVTVDWNMGESAVAQAMIGEARLLRSLTRTQRRSPEYNPPLG
jgi:hypothetical protein